jgi:hypothetical protein
MIHRQLGTYSDRWTEAETDKQTNMTQRNLATDMQTRTHTIHRRPRELLVIICCLLQGCPHCRCISMGCVSCKVRDYLPVLLFVMASLSSYVRVGPCVSRFPSIVMLVCLFECLLVARWPTCVTRSKMLYVVIRQARVLSCALVCLHECLSTLSIPPTYIES